jgi:hypothetical protein
MKSGCCRPIAPPSPSEARQSLNACAAALGAGIHRKYGPRIGWSELLRLLQDRDFVRYSCEIVFDAALLRPGELAHPVAKGEHPRDGFSMHVHPFFISRLEQVPVLVLYQLVLVNYGAFAVAADAEAFGAAALGLERDDYYETLCRLADELERTAAQA